MDGYHVQEGLLALAIAWVLSIVCMVGRLTSWDLGVYLLLDVFLFDLCSFPFSDALCICCLLGCFSVFLCICFMYVALCIELMLAGLELVYGNGSMGVWLVPGFLDDSEYSLFLQLAV
ncbi:hypothetical protein Tco_1199112 [Tanacetum coccineum]